MNRLLAALSIILLVGCSSTMPEPDPDPFSGFYGLTTVDGVAFDPWSSTDSTTTRLLDDNISVSSDGRWIERTLVGMTNPLRTTSVPADSGHWTRSGDVVTFSSSVSGAQGYSGTFVSRGSRYGMPTLALRNGNGPLKLFEQYPPID